MWRSRCAVTNRRFGGHVILTLTRWDASLPPTPYNLALLMQNEAQKLHDQGAQAAFSPEVVARVNERLRWAKKVCEDSWETLDHTGGNQPCPVVVRKREVGVKSEGPGHGLCEGRLISSGICAATVAFMLGYGASRYANK